MADDQQDRSTTFGIGDLLSKIKSEGLPANARAYLETAFSHAFNLPNPKFGNEFFTETQLELLRKAIKNRKSNSIPYYGHAPLNLDLLEFADGDPLGSDPGTVSQDYDGPLADKLGIGFLLKQIYNDREVLQTSLGGFTVQEDDKNYYISDPFDFSGNPMTLLESIKDADQDPDRHLMMYSALRNWATTMSSEAYPDGTSPPVFELKIPKEGPIPRGPVPENEPEKRAHGGFVDKPLYDRDPYG